MTVRAGIDEKAGACRMPGRSDEEQGIE